MSPSHNLDREASSLSPAQVRTELERAIRRRGITVVAAETGAAHQTLRAYLAGARVHTDTSSKLTRWCAAHAEDEGHPAA